MVYAASRHVSQCKTVRYEGHCQQRSDHVNSSGQCARPWRCQSENARILCLHVVIQFYLFDRL